MALNPMVNFAIDIRNVGQRLISKYTLDLLNEYNLNKLFVIIH